VGLPTERSKRKTGQYKERWKGKGEGENDPYEKKKGPHDKNEGATIGGVSRLFFAVKRRKVEKGSIKNSLLLPQPGKKKNRKNPEKSRPPSLNKKSEH